MALSMLGFNPGIEFMQVGIIALVIPWLILLSQTPYYRGLRDVGAGSAAGTWVIERASGQPNAVAAAVEQGAARAGWLVAGAKHASEVNRVDTFAPKAARKTNRPRSRKFTLRPEWCFSPG